MSIIELLNKVGIENVKVQPLNTSLTNSRETKHKDTELTFATNQLSTTDVAMGTGPIGLVLWIPRDKMP